MQKIWSKSWVFKGRYQDGVVTKEARSGNQVTENFTTSGTACRPYQQAVRDGVGIASSNPIYIVKAPMPSERRMTEETTKLAAATIVRSHPSRSAVSITIAITTITISSILHPLLLVIVIHHIWRHCKTLLRFNLFEIQFLQYNVYDYVLNHVWVVLTGWGLRHSLAAIYVHLI